MTRELGEPIGEGRWQLDETAAIAAVSRLPEQAHLHIGARMWVAYQGTIRLTPSPLGLTAEEPASALAVANVFDELGEAALAQIRGAFALAVLDRLERRLLLAVDRMGTHCLQYFMVPGGLVFASSSGAIRAHPAARPPIDLQALFNYLFFHVVPSPRGMFEGFTKLMPGEYLLFGDGKIEKSFYWRAEFVDDNGVNEPELTAEFSRCLRNSIRRALNAGGRKGAFLSGGTDSSTVAGVMAELQAEPTPAFSIGFDVEGYDELRFARIAAKHFGLDHHEYYLTPKNVVDTVPLLARAYDEPFGNASAIAAYHCARAAREHGVDLMLAGDGGDELFAGNQRYATQRLFELYGRVPRVIRESCIEPFVSAVSPETGIYPFRKLRRYVDQARIPLPDRLQTYNFLLKEPLRDIFEPDFLATVNPSEPIELLRTTFFRANGHGYLNRMLFLDLKHTLADDDLRKVTGTCELAGVDVRYPLLDDQIVELAARVPERLKLRGLMLRYFFKRALRDFLPREILKKRKHGFGVPCGIWIRDYPPLRELAFDSLSSLKSRRFLRSAYLDRLFLLHRTSDARYYGVMIWVLMMLEHWFASQEKERNGRTTAEALDTRCIRY